MGELTTSIQYLSGVGPKRAELLRRELGIETLSDLIHLYPFRYIDRSGIVPIAQVAPDVAFVQIQATVVSRTLYGPQSAVVSETGLIADLADACLFLIRRDCARFDEICEGVETFEESGCRFLGCVMRS